MKDTKAVADATAEAIAEAEAVLLQGMKMDAPAVLQVDVLSGEINLVMAK